MSACVVRGCTLTYANRPEGVMFFRFPNDERLPAWVEAVKGKGSNWVPPKNVRICSQHFAPQAFWKNHPGKRQKVLLPGAVPIPAVQLPPASTILPKHLPNSNTYVYRMKECAGVSSEALASPSHHEQSPISTSKTSVSCKTGVSVRRNTVSTTSRTLSRHVKSCKTSAASPESIHSNSLQLPRKSPAADITESSPSTSSIPTASSRVLLNGTSQSVVPCSPQSCKRGAFPLNVTETSPKVMVWHGPPVPVCLDIKENDSPCKVALKQMIMHLENQLKEERRGSQLKDKKLKEAERKCEKYKKELDAMKEIVKKAIGFDLRCFSIDAPLHWGDKAIIWHARPAPMDA